MKKEVEAFEWIPGQPLSAARREQQRKRTSARVARKRPSRREDEKKGRRTHPQARREHGLVELAVRQETVLLGAVLAGEEVATREKENVSFRREKVRKKGEKGRTRRL
jgi:hypothetical protein